MTPLLTIHSRATFASMVDCGQGAHACGACLAGVCGGGGGAFVIITRANLVFDHQFDLHMASSATLPVLLQQGLWGGSQREPHSGGSRVLGPPWQPRVLSGPFYTSAEHSTHFTAFRSWPPAVGRQGHRLFLVLSEFSSSWGLGGGHL